jgi:hypothetical protein
MACRESGNKLQRDSDSYVDIGMVGIADFLSAVRSPPASIVGFDIRPEDEAAFQALLNKSPTNT